MQGMWQRVTNTTASDEQNKICASKIRNLLGVDKGWTDIGTINKHKHKLTIYKNNS